MAILRCRMVFVVINKVFTFLMHKYSLFWKEKARGSNKCQIKVGFAKPKQQITFN